MRKTVKRILKALSADGIEVNASRQLANLKIIDPEFTRELFLFRLLLMPIAKP